MSITSPVSICSLALSHLGNFGTVTNIDNPSNDKEITFANWYDVTRQICLQLLMPNFALRRMRVAKQINVPEFGYAYYYEYPNNCLKLLGIGNLLDGDDGYSVEADATGVTRILTDQDYPTGMPIRYVQDIADVNAMTADFIFTFSYFLAMDVALDITQDAAKANLMIKKVQEQMQISAALNGQENKPVRVSHSKFRAAHYGGTLYSGKK